MATPHYICETCEQPAEPPVHHDHGAYDVTLCQTCDRCRFREQRGKRCAQFKAVALWCGPCRRAAGLCELCGRKTCDCVETPRFGKMLKEYAAAHPEDVA